VDFVKEGFVVEGVYIQQGVFFLTTGVGVAM
jgi:hypothetical protein